MEWNFRRQGRGPSRRSLLSSVLFHVVVGVSALLATLGPAEPNTFITYEIEIVSPPAQQVEEEDTPAPATEELQIERPDEAPEPETTEEAVPLPEAEPEEAVPDPEPEETPPEPEPRPEPEETPPAATEAPEEESDVSGEDLEIRMEGLRRDFPEYYANIVTQIRRCFRPPSGVPSGLETVLYFVIRPDGTVTDLRFVEQSGNPDLDYEALGAVGDCAGRGRFGPLPEDLPYERLPIQFTFRPSGDDAPDGTLP
ncbi:MAG: energy transducer TonB [Gemmatimonadota bacterium]